MILSDKLPKHITEEAVEGSVNRKIASLKKEGGLTALVALLREAEELLKHPSPDMRPLVDQMLGEVSGVIAKHTPCKKGCSSCCYMAVTVTSHEAKRISMAYNLPPAAVQPNYDQEAVIQKYVGCKCPFLDHGVCQIYEHRPDACRGFFNLSDFPELCDVITYLGSDVPSIDLQPYWLLSSYVSALSGETAADIREFFPDGLHPTQSL